MFLPIGSDEPIPRRSFPIVTLMIVGVNVVVFMWELLIGANGGDAALESFIQAYGAIPREILTGRDFGPPGPSPVYLTLITSMFMHAGWLHIIGNMLYLLAFGDNVEDRMGHLGFVAFYLISGLAAAFGQIVLDPTSAIPSVGASGAIAGVLGGYILLFPSGIVRALVIYGPFLRIARVPAIAFLLFWFITQFLSGIASLGIATAETGGVAYWAHIGGFVMGLVLAGLHKVLFER